jgi:hypothetical protein
LHVAYAPHHHSIQDEVRESVLHHIVPIEVLLELVQVLLQDAAQDGIPSPFLTTVYVMDVAARASLRAAIVEGLGVLTTLCPSSKYPVIQALAHGGLTLPLRRSVLADVLAISIDTKILAELQRAFRARKDHEFSHLEVVRAVAPAHVCTKGQTRVLLIALTTHALRLVLQKAHGCSVCPPENFCPHEPEVETRWLVDLTRLVSGFGNQAFACGWLEGETEVLDYFVAHRGREPLFSELDTCACARAASHNAQIRDAAPKKGTAKSLVAGDIYRCFDFVTRDAALFRLTDRFAPLLACSFAHREDEGMRFSLFMLTGTAVIELEPKLHKWNYVDQVEYDRGYETPEDIRPINDDEEDMDHHARKDKANSNELLKALQTFGDMAINNVHDRARKDRDGKAYQGIKEGNSQEEKRRALVRDIKQGLFDTLMHKHLVDLNSVAFGPLDDPSLTLSFGASGGKRGKQKAETFTIRFFSDSAREHWRIGLGSAMTASDVGTPWKRDWVPFKASA